MYVITLKEIAADAATSSVNFYLREWLRDEPTYLCFYNKYFCLLIENLECLYHSDFYIGYYPTYVKAILKVKIFCSLKN